MTQNPNQNTTVLNEISNPADMHSVASNSGGIAVGATEVVVVIPVESNTNTTTNAFEQNGVVYETDVPSGALDYSGPGEPKILPSAMYSIPIGSHGISHEVQYPGDCGGETKTATRTRAVNVIETTKGKALNIGAFSMYQHDRWPFNPTVARLANELGFVYGDYSVEAMPTPETIVSAAKALGVDIELIPDKGELESSQYLGIFKDRKYPVSTAVENYYKHDIQDDHLFAVVLGGEPLKKGLQEVATKAIDSGDREIMNDITAKIDSFTATLRLVTYNGVGEAYGPERGRGTFLRTSGELGIDEATAFSILAEAQQNAAKFGIDVTPLK